jgi:formylglycine-generating enzyme required for sulfatase activity
VTFGCGSVLSTVDDLVAWDRALSGTTLLGDASKRRMFAPGRDVGAIVSPPAKYGYGWFVAQDAGHDVFFHGGGVDGFEAQFARVPDARVTVVVLSNLLGSEAVTKVAQAVRELALTGKAPEPPDERTTTAFDPSQLAGFVGDYGIDRASEVLIRDQLPREADSLRGLSLTTADGRLFMNFASPPREVLRGVDGELFTKHGVTLAPEVDASGRVAAIVVVWLDHGPLRARYQRLGTRLDATSSLGTCLAGMVRLPGGPLATEHGGANIEPFCIDLTEVTVKAYEACMRSGKCVEEPTTAAWDGISPADQARWSPACNGKRRDRQDHPMNCVSWAQSTAYCRVQGKRLPTANEWEWAARGGEQGRTFPWGFRAPDSQVCWSGIEKRSSTCPVGSLPEGDALGGIHDLAGNVWEWTSDTVGGTDHVMRGMGWNETDATHLRGDARLPGGVGEAGFRGPTTGFRCAR